MSDIESLQKLKVVELKKQLKEKGLSTTGKKDQLVKLLHELYNIVFKFNHF